MVLRKHIKKILLYFCMLCVSIFILVPILWILFMSFQYEEDIIAPTFSLKPREMIIDNYKYIFTGVAPRQKGSMIRSRVVESARYILPTVVNSLIIASCVALINFGVGLSAAYTFLYKKFTGKEAIFVCVLLSRLLPPVAVVIPFFIIIKSLNLLDTKLSLILIYSAMTLPLTVFFFRGYLSRIPSEVIDAAFVDGCSELQMMWRILIPMAKGGVLAGTILAFFLSYIEFLFALSLAQTYRSKTMPVLIAAISSSRDISWSLLCADVILAIIPTVIIGFIVRKYLVGGIIPQLR